jgi:hypothetical protein
MPINTNGPITLATRANLTAGVRSRPMGPEAVDAVLRQASEFADSLVSTYESSVATGEVGVGGSARASEAPPIGPRAPSALLYGRVQSGKTAAMVLTAALALDNGFRLVIVLTADNVDLVRQTANRFKDIEGPRVLSTLKENDTAEWRAPDSDASEQDFIDDVARDGLVFVCAKNALHIPQVLAFLQRIDAASFPALIFDDEADAATPDHTLQARSSGRANAPDYASTINRRIIENTRPGEEGQSALEILPHNMYVQVTASPFVLLLQRRTSRLRPTLSFLLEPGEGYRGGEEFFGEFDPESDEAPTPPLVLVADREAGALARRPTPTGLAASIEFAILSSAVLALDREWPSDGSGYKHLSHTSSRVDQHTLVAEHIERHLTLIRRELRDSPNAGRARFEAAYRELGRSTNNVPELAQLMPVITSITRQAQVLRVNASSQRAAYGPRLNFLVGGNILGRGLTIDYLLVTYYLRQAQVSQMDTVLQHARMYGYRELLMPYTRLYLPRQLAILFKEIHESEQSVRAIVGRQTRGEDVPIRIATGARATRPGALETGSLRVYDGSMGQVSPSYLIDDVDSAQLRELLSQAGVPLTEPDRERRSTRVPIATIRSLVEMMEPRADDPGRWSVEAALALIAAYEGEYGANGIVYVRQFAARPDRERTRARLSGPEVDVIRGASPSAPALALLYWDEQPGPTVWFPTLVFPRDMPTFVFGPA